MKITKLAIILLLGIVGCEEDTTNTEQSAPTNNTEIAKSITTESEEETKQVSKYDRTTLEGFYNILKEAIVTRDLETLQTLFAEGTSKYSFDDPEEQSLIAATQFSDIVKSTDTNGNKELYELYFEFSLNQEMIDAGMEASTEGIIMQKNDSGEYEIFIMSFAG